MFTSAAHEGPSLCNLEPPPPLWAQAGDYDSAAVAASIRALVSYPKIASLAALANSNNRLEPIQSTESAINGIGSEPMRRILSRCAGIGSEPL
jgi:hypothetical protein